MLEKLQDALEAAQAEGREDISALLEEAVRLAGNGDGAANASSGGGTGSGDGPPA